MGKEGRGLGLSGLNFSGLWFGNLKKTNNNMLGFKDCNTAPRSPCQVPSRPRFHPVQYKNAATTPQSRGRPAEGKAWLAGLSGCRRKTGSGALFLATLPGAPTCQGCADRGRGAHEESCTSAAKQSAGKCCLQLAHFLPPRSPR